MSERTHFILIFTSCLCLSSYSDRTIAATPNPQQNIIQLAQASSPQTNSLPIDSLPTDLLSTDSLVLIHQSDDSSEVKVIQIQLKALGYYDGFIDGQYGYSTQKALSKFQKAQGLQTTNGIADQATKKRLATTLSEQTKCINSSVPIPTPIVKTESQVSNISFIWWSLFGLGLIGNVCILYLIRKFYQIQKISQFVTSEQQLLNPSGQNANSGQKLLNPSGDNHARLSLNSAQTTELQFSPELLPPAKTALLPKVNIVDELIKELRSADPTKRRKAIWDLTQQGDSRAIQPLVDLIIDADSQQHGLILSALAEIGTRTLKPMNRALAMSMQDENPQVRQNAIRDLMRIYDMMNQMSQIVRHALEDPDPDVQATARYALNNINRIRSVPNEQFLRDPSSEEHN